MPFPKSKESKNKFIARFMKSKEAQGDYPSSDQRLAIAHNIWKQQHNKQALQKARKEELTKV